jgi:DNA-binding beta-propeller fold protein YncE
MTQAMTTMRREFESEMRVAMTLNRFTAISALFASLWLALPASAQVLPEAQIGVRIPLAKKPTTRPMGVAYSPLHQRYFVADGGLGPVPGSMDITTSRSEVHVFDASGKYLQSALPGLDNRAIYFNPNTQLIETITYNVSSSAGFTPGTGIYSLEINDKGELTENTRDIISFNPAFGDAATMPSYDAKTQRYYAKQERSNRVWVVDPKQREKVSEIVLDLDAAGARYDDISDHFIAYTGIAGEELAVLDVDHKAVLVFDLNGKLVGKSALPPTLKLLSQNHYNGVGYSNGMVFVYAEREGEFGTYLGFKVSDQVAP